MVRVLGLRQLGAGQPGNLTSSASFTPARRILQHPADEREARAVVDQERGRGAHVAHGQRVVDSGCKVDVRAVGGHADILPLTCRRLVTLLKLKCKICYAARSNFFGRCPNGTRNHAGFDGAYLPKNSFAPVEKSATYVLLGIGL